MFDEQQRHDEPAFYTEVPPGKDLSPTEPREMEPYHQPAKSLERLPGSQISKRSPAEIDITQSRPSARPGQHLKRLTVLLAVIVIGLITIIVVIANSRKTAIAAPSPSPSPSTSPAEPSASGASSSPVNTTSPGAASSAPSNSAVLSPTPPTGAAVIYGPTDLTIPPLSPGDYGYVDLRIPEVSTGNITESDLALAGGGTWTSYVDGVKVAALGTSAASFSSCQELLNTSPMNLETQTFAQGQGYCVQLPPTNSEANPIAYIKFLMLTPDNGDTGTGEVMLVATLWNGPASGS